MSTLFRRSAFYFRSMVFLAATFFLAPQLVYAASPITVYVTMGNTIGCSVIGRGNVTDFLIDPLTASVHGTGETHAGTTSKETMKLDGTVNQATGELQGSISGVHTYRSGDEAFELQYSGPFQAVLVGDHVHGWTGKATLKATSVIRKNTAIGLTLNQGMACDDFIHIENTNSVDPLSGETVQSVATPIDSSAPTALGDCPGDHRVKRGDFCGCAYGYESNVEAGGCHFITEKLGLSATDVEKINDAVAAVGDSAGEVTSTHIAVNGATLSVAVTSDPGDRSATLYTIDGIHFSHSLADVIDHPHGARLLNGLRTFLTELSPYNWFGSAYSGDDKSLKFDIGRALAYDDIDHKRSTLVGSLKYLRDFQSGLSAYIDLREAGKTPDTILSGDQDIDAEIERVTSRLRVAVQGKTDGMSEADKTKLDAAQKKELYAAYEDGFHRYLAAKALGK